MRRGRRRRLTRRSLLLLWTLCGTDGVQLDTWLRNLVFVVERDALQGGRA